MQVVTAPSSVTMTSAVVFARDLADALIENDAVALQLAPLMDADLSFVQIVYAAREQAGRDGKSLCLSGPANPVVAALLERAGFLTEPDPADIDFWFHGTLPQ